MIFLQIHYTNTKKAISERITEYNNQVKESNPNDWRKHTLKATHQATAFAILDQYAKYLDRNATHKPLSSKKTGTIHVEPFKTNNVALVTQRNNLLNRSSIWRHINRLTEAGILMPKKPLKERGTNTGFELKFNPSLLHATYNKAYNEALVEGYYQATKEENRDDNEIQKLYLQLPSFTDFPHGIVAFCNHTDTSSLQEPKNNMESGIVNDSKKQEQWKTEKTALPYLVPQPLTYQSPSQRIKQDHKAGGAKKSDKNLLKLFVVMAWNFAQSVLWKDQEFCDADIAVAQRHIEQYFEPCTTGTHLKFSDYHQKFCESVSLAARYRDKDAARFIPSPVLWFSPQFNYGLTGAVKWQEAMHLKRKRNKEYYQNLREMCWYYKQFTRYRSMGDYMAAVKALSQKKDKYWLDTFNRCVENASIYSPELFAEAWKMNKTAA